MENVKELYGIEPMGFMEEVEYLKTHPYSARTRNDKRRLIVAFEKMRKTAEAMKEYCKRIPVEEDENHAFICRQFTEHMEDFERKLSEQIEHDIYHPWE